MPDISAAHLSAKNAQILQAARDFSVAKLIDPDLTWYHLRPCRVRVLVIADGLDFSLDNFGLATFVDTLLDTGGRVRFQVTLGHIGTVSNAAMMDFDARIANRIENFRFDEPTHFGPMSYDVVFLFGIAQSFFGRGTSPGGQAYPGDSLSDAELQVLAEFQNSGGGVFATGDHGRLGRFLCHRVARARHMRLWDNTSGNDDLNEVSMAGERRNDTNRPGDPGSQFEDQSDAIPQPIQPRIYSRTYGFFRYTFPHPLLCGPNGVIRVMPDHPHEGECIEGGPDGETIDYTGAIGPEFPPASGPWPRPLPEVISTNTVLSGTTSGGKDPTTPHSFGGISAYDGHRAGVGRVVTDATWHHFVNINLTGDRDVPPLDPKSEGFLATPAGQAAFENIKTYFRNLALWLARPENISCINTRILWGLVWSDRVLEAVLTTTEIKLTAVDVHTLSIIGRHARDVLGKFAGQCQSVRLILDLVWEEVDLKRIPEIDPWIVAEPRRGEDGVPWMDGRPLLDIALGGALVAINQAHPRPDAKLAEDLGEQELTRIAREGARVGLDLARASLKASLAAVEQRMLG